MELYQDINTKADSHRKKDKMPKPVDSDKKLNRNPATLRLVRLLIICGCQC